MSGDAFVVGDRFVVDQRALREVGSRYDDAARALAIRRARDIVGCRRGLEGGYGFNRDRRLRKKSEELGKLRLHLRNVMAEVVEYLLGRCGNVFRIRFE